MTTDCVFTLPKCARRGADLVNLHDVLTVPLLSHVAEASCDVDPAADVHVHLHGFLLDLGVQIRQVLSGGCRNHHFTFPFNHGASYDFLLE